MSIKTLEVSNVRNLQSALLECSTFSNLIIGPNGSGKTSLLESMAVLSQGKSFRHSLKKSIISEGQPSLTVSALIQDSRSHSGETRIGISKTTNGKTVAKVARERVQKVSTLSSLLPICIIDPNSTDIIEGGPSYRRQLIDWGVFHVEHGFMEHWRRFTTTLKQRNALLKQTKTISSDQLSYWNRLIVPAAEVVSNMRQQYVAALAPTLTDSFNRFFSEDSIRISLQDGWSTEGYLACLEENADRDCRYGFTTAGPHKAELEIRANEHLAKDYLSRGQKKLVVYALKLAQIEQIQKHTGRRVSLLLDDLPSELDRANCEKVCEEIKRIGCQVFITSIDNTDLNSMIIDTLDPHVFHVEHGVVSV